MSQHRFVYNCLSMTGDNGRLFTQHQVRGHLGRGLSDKEAIIRACEHLPPVRPGFVRADIRCTMTPKGRGLNLIVYDDEVIP